MELSGEAIAGYQVWELYEEAWRKKQKEKHHLCSVVQELQGTAVDGPEDWGSAVAVYEVSLDLQDSDCEDSVAEDERYWTLTHVVVTDAPADEVAIDDPFPGDSLGWSASFDGVSMQALGFAWHQDLETGEGATLSGWVDGEAYVLWSAYAWDVGEG